MSKARRHHDVERQLAAPTPSVIPAAASPLSRRTFDGYWLQGVTEAPTATHGFERHILEEKDGIRPTIQPHLIEALQDHHIHRRRIADALNTLGHTEAASFFAAEMPRSNNTRKGNFGEVVASEHLMQRYGYHMPVFKLRYRDSTELPMRGEDIIAFALDAANHIERVIVGEAKAIVAFATRTVVEANERLCTAFSPRPMTLSLIAELLYAEGNDALGREVDRVAYEFTRRAFPRECWLFLINQTQPADAFDVLADGRPLAPSLRCVRLSLGEMTAFVNTLFSAPIVIPGVANAS